MEVKSKQREFGVPTPSTLHNRAFNLMAKITILALLIGSISFPNQAEAGIFSKMAGLFSNEAKADVIDNGQNSQTTPVLEAKISLIGSEEKKEEAPLKINEDNVLVPEMGTLGTTLDVEDYTGEDKISVYITKSGDTLSKIAEMYNVSVNTIVWANESLDPKKSLKEGTSILIMPISGVSHTIRKGDTLNAIAKKYGADAVEIARFNGVTDETLVVGESIMVPDGEIAPSKTVATTTPKKIISIKIPGLTGRNSYYRRPVNCPLTQGIHNYNGVDLGCSIGTPVVAAAAGTVISVRTGWGGGYGNHIILSHPNGTQTLYAHLSKISVSVGQQISDGEVIGNTGNSGRSTGPHLHFEIRNSGIVNCMVNNSCR